MKIFYFYQWTAVSVLEAGVKSIFPDTLVQRCVVHLIRNSTKYIPSKHLKAFLADCKAMYTAINIEAAEDAFKSLKDTWGNDYPGAIQYGKTTLIT